jgi:hypothetical protein
VVIGLTWNGISIGGVDGLQIVNNTVLGIPSKTMTPWIEVGSTTHEGGKSNHTIVRNNIAPSIINNTSTNPTQVLVEDHNLQTHSWPALEVAALFDSFNTATDAYFLNLRAGTSAIGTGSPISAPALDLNGVPRTVPIDLGAYK